MDIYQEIKDVYASGKNVSRYLRDKLGLNYNNDKTIELTYDIQSGSYVDAVSTEESKQFKKKYTDEMAKIINGITPNIKSLLKGGTGECITLTGILNAFPFNIKHVYGFDMCWSRIGYGEKYLLDHNIDHVKLCTGTLSEPPFLENSFQVVVTSHSMEPNGGREDEILKALYRVAGEWLVLFEPSYMHANQEGKDRMDKLGYIKDIHERSKELGYNVISHYPLKHSLNPLNPTAVTIIKKESKVLDEPIFACPLTQTSLVKTSDGYFSEKGMCIYPEIMGLPCLKVSNGVIASKYLLLNSRIK